MSNLSDEIVVVEFENKYYVYENFNKDWYLAVLNGTSFDIKIDAISYAKKISGNSKLGVHVMDSLHTADVYIKLLEHIDVISNEELKNKLKNYEVKHDEVKKLAEEQKIELKGNSILIKEYCINGIEGVKKITENKISSILEILSTLCFMNFLYSQTEYWLLVKGKKRSLEELENFKEEAVRRYIEKNQNINLDCIHPLVRPILEEKMKKK
jgi:hypothetical protein